jgi:transposase
MGQEVISKISFICSDMWEPYLKVIREKCSEALHILDRLGSTTAFKPICVTSRQHMPSSAVVRCLDLSTES